MVNGSRLYRFARHQDGAVLVEGLVVFPLLLLAFAAFFEFGYAVFQWNQTVKALQAGARHLAVSQPLTPLGALTADYTGTGPDPVPADILSVSCGDGVTACSPAELNRLIFGADADGTDDSCDHTVFNTIPGMCDFNDRIGTDNVKVTYYRAGLGYEERPYGPVVTIRLEVKDLPFDLPLVGALLGLGTFPIPASPVTITSEDLCSTRSCS